MPREGADREFVLLRFSDAHKHVILRAFARQKKAHEACLSPLRAQEGGRIHDLVKVWKRKPIILGKQVVQVRRAATPDAKDKQRRRHFGASGPSVKNQRLPPAQNAVRHASQGDQAGTSPVAPINGKMILPQDAEPTPERHPGKRTWTEVDRKRFTPIHASRCSGTTVRTGLSYAYSEVDERP